MWRPNVRPVSDAARGKALFGPPMFMQNSEVSSHTGLRVVFSAFPELEQVPSLRVNSWVDSSGFVACCACWRRATNQSLNAAITELRMPRQLWKVKYFRRNVQIATPQAGVFAGLFRARVRFHFASSFSRSSILQQIFHSSAHLPLRLSGSSGGCASVPFPCCRVRAQPAATRASLSSGIRSRASIDLATSSAMISIRLSCARSIQ